MSTLAFVTFASCIYDLDHSWPDSDAPRAMDLALGEQAADSSSDMKSDASPDLSPDLQSPDLTSPDLKSGICIGQAGKVCRSKKGQCDLAEKCVAGLPNCPADKHAAAGTTCRAKADACDLAEKCTGTSPICPANGLASKSVVCRSSTGTCDPAESCTGSSATCPSDTKWIVQAKTYKSVGGGDGYIHRQADGKFIGNGNWLEAGWGADGSESQGFLYFETTPLPSATTVTSVSLTGCHNGGPGVNQAQLYTASFAFAISPAAWNSAKTYLKAFNSTKGSQTLTLPITAVNKGASTQFSIKYPKPSPLASVYKRFATSTGVVLGNCAAQTPWVLQVKHCGP